MSAPTLLVALASLLAGAVPGKPEEAPPPPSFSGIHVLVWTAGGLVTGHDLRYRDGDFRLRQEKGDVTLAEAAVKQVQFLDLPHDEMRDPVVGLAVRVAYLRRVGPPKRLPLFERIAFVQRLLEGIFLRPEEPVADAFPRVASALWHADLAALLCLETALRCHREGRMKEAVALFEGAEAASAARPDHAFVYALMRLAILPEADRAGEEQNAIRHIAQKYPDRVLDVARFRARLRDPGDRPFLPHPGKGPRPAP
ncbi:MAG: hypothetical protein FJ290_18335 [Planctomycetes bacterium]|nr:hypothetical protein [Planctomycetota bacterium]